MLHFYSTLRQVGPLTIALTLALAGNFAYSAWSNPATAPINGNVAAPINEGSDTQSKSGTLTVSSLGTAGQVTAGTWISAVNDIAAGGNIRANGFVRASSSVRSNQYCDYAGNNCFTPTSVDSSIDTSTFLDTSGTAQSKSGDLTVRDLTVRDLEVTRHIKAVQNIFSDGLIRASSSVRSNQYCDYTGNNCFSRTNVPNPTSNTHIANKSYVDTQIQNAVNSIRTPGFNEVGSYALAIVSDSSSAPETIQPGSIINGSLLCPAQIQANSNWSNNSSVLQIHNVAGNDSTILDEVNCDLITGTWQAMGYAGRSYGSPWGGGNRKATLFLKIANN